MPLKSKMLIKTVRRVFTDSEMHALIARLSVLYEDLRIEMFGTADPSVGRLDYSSEAYRKNYFLRRSLATLVEIEETFRLLDVNVDFQKVKDNFDRKNAIRWNRAIRFFKRYGPILKRVRNDIGGHFGYAAARYAIKNIESQTVAKIELAREGSRGVGVKLHFAGEIAIYALVRHRGDKKPEEYAEYIIRIIAIGYRQAIHSIDAINACYLWDRFRG